MKAFIWNIRSVKSQQAFQRVQMLHKFHNFLFIGLMEPFQDSRHINKYRRRLRMSNATTNCNGKIWFFTNHDVDFTIIKDTDQQLTMKLKHHSLTNNLFVTLVYAKCNSDQRLLLWEHIYEMAAGMDNP